MNLEKIVIIKEDLCSIKLAERLGLLGGNAVAIVKLSDAKQYAEKMCKKQKQLCKEPFMNNVYYDDVCDKIGNASLATED